MILQTEKNSQSLQNDASSSLNQSPAPQSVHERQGCWQQSQILKFVSYLIYNRQSLKLKLQRRTSKIFKQMAQFIGTRNAIQCHSLNQRLFRKHRNFRSIIASFKSKYGSQRFQKDYETMIKSDRIKFKTDYEYYLDQQIRDSREIACQTEPSLLQNQINSFLYPQVVNSFMLNVSPFWMVLPYQI